MVGLRREVGKWGEEGKGKRRDEERQEKLRRDEKKMDKEGQGGTRKNEDKESKKGTKIEIRVDKDG